MTPAPVGAEPRAEAEPGAKLGAKLEMDGAEPELPLADAVLGAKPSGAEPAYGAAVAAAATSSGATAFMAGPVLGPVLAETCTWC